MIEVHGTRREAAAAVGTWTISKLVQQAGMCPPTGTLAIEILRRAR